jgi:lipid-A-disaccharide synthase
MYGAQLIEALRRSAEAEETRARRTDEAPSAPREIEFFGVGGQRMRAAGCDTVVDAKDLSVVGITEILSHLPKIYGRYRHLIAEADERKPDLAIVIDSPAFNWRVARQMKRRGVPVVYYVAPQFWAWRQGRVRLLRDYVDKTLVIFPFEEKFYRDRGVDATFVGHPLADLPQPAIKRADYAAQFHLNPAKHWITIMPGSRVKEVRLNLPTILEAAYQLGPDYHFLLPVAPTLDRDFLQNLVAQGSQGERPVTLVPESLPALWHSRAGIIASGTATVEAAMMGTPFVMVYRVSALTYVLGKPRVKVPHFAMVNLIAGEQVVPELVQENFTAANVVEQLGQILPDGLVRNRMTEALSRVKARLRTNENDTDNPTISPAERAAEIILSLANLSSRESNRK